jgi:hypothetical protein
MCLNPFEGAGCGLWSYNGMAFCGSHRTALPGRVARPERVSEARGERPSMPHLCRMPLASQDSTLPMTYGRGTDGVWHAITSLRQGVHPPVVSRPPSDGASHAIPSQRFFGGAASWFLNAGCDMHVA